MERQREDLRERKPYYASSVPAVPVHQDEPRKKCTAPCRRGALQRVEKVFSTRYLSF